MKLILKTRHIFLLLAIILFLSFPAFSENAIWDGGGDGTSWSDPSNWNPNNVPDDEDDVTIDCSCTITHNADLEINGSLTLASGTTLDMGGKKLTIGGSFWASAKTATLTNNGTIRNADDIKVKGDKFLNLPSHPKGTDVGEGPFIINSGTITTKKMSIGNNNGGGKLTNTSTGIINVTDTGNNSVHVDGTICNEGTINVTNEVLFHGAVVTCGGIFNAAIIKLEDNPWAGGGASGGGSDIQSQSFSDGAGCSGASSISLIYKVSGGVDGGPNGDDTYTYQELLDEFGTTDTNPVPQFMVDPALVYSCGEAQDNTPPVITDVPEDILAYVTEDSCTKSVTWIPPTITDENGILLDSSSHEPGHIFDADSTTIVTYYAQDNSGNTNEVSFTITIVDNISPVINDLPANITQYTDDGSCGAIVNWTLPTASDNCSASLSPSHNPGDFFAIGQTTVTYTALDIHGNSMVSTFDVTVTDKTGPTFSFCPSVFRIESVDTIVNKSVITWDMPTAVDACSEISLSSNYNSSDAFDFGITTVVYTATDQSGNIAQCSFDVESILNTPPLVDNIFMNAKAGQSIHIYMNVTDPEGDQVFIESITNNANNSYLSNIDKENMHYIYTSFVDFYGIDTLDVTFVDNGMPVKSAHSKVIIEVERVATIEIAGAITPDGDMMNDTWYIKNIDHYMENSVNVFDRWGGLLYQTTGYNNTSIVWDGTSNRGQNKRIPTGTYFYVIDLGNGSKKFTGAIELIR